MKSVNMILLSLLLLSITTVNAQETNYIDWINAGQPALQSNSTNPPVPFGGALTTYADLTSFQASGVMTVLEDFEGGLTGAGAVNTCVPPVNSLSNDPCFTPGDLISGFNISATGTGTNQVVALGAGVVGNADVVMGANSFADVTVLTFDATNIQAVAFDLQTNAAGPVSVRVFDAGGVLIDTLSIVANPSFVGFTSPVAIGSIELEDDTAGGELFDNLRFGTMGPPAIIPTLSFTSIGLLLMLMLIVALRFKTKNT